MDIQELQRKAMRHLQEEMALAKAKEQESCQHMAGCHAIGLSCSNLTSIFWHQLRDSSWFGVCSVCQRHFKSEDADFLYWFNKKSQSVKSASGNGIGIPVTEEEYVNGREGQFNSNERDDQEQRDFNPYSTKWIDKLSDLEVKFLYEASIREKKLNREREDGNKRFVR